MKNKLLLILIMILFHSVGFSQNSKSVIGTYNNWEYNWQLRIYENGNLNFYVVTNPEPFDGTWKINGKNIEVIIPEYINRIIKYKIKKDGLYNEKGKLVWDKAEG